MDVEYGSHIECVETCHDGMVNNLHIADAMRVSSKLWVGYTGPLPLFVSLIRFYIVLFLNRVTP